MIGHVKATWRLEGARSEYERFLLEQRDYRAIEKSLVPEAPPGARRRGFGTLSLPRGEGTESRDEL